MATITLRNVKGAPLTNSEVDANFTALNTELSGKQENLVSGTNIKTINGATILGSGDMVISSLPIQTGQTGKFLSTDGTTANWYALGSIVSQNANNVLITGGVATLKSLDLFFATGTSQLRIGTSNNYFWDISRDNDTTGDLVISNKNSGTQTEKLRIKTSGDFVIGGSGGTSGQVLISNGTGAAPTWQTLNLSWSAITSKPTTIGGFGITDAQATLVSGTNIKTINGSSILGSGDVSINPGAIITDDSTTNNDLFPIFGSSTSGNLTTAKVSSTKLSFNPSTGQLNSTSFNSTSDERLKENIQEIKSGLNIVEALSGKIFNFKGDQKPTSGFIAQEIRKVIPHVVSSQETGYLSVNYDAVIPYLVEAIKELSQANKELKAEISAIKGN